MDQTKYKKEIEKLNYFYNNFFRDKKEVFDNLNQSINSQIELDERKMEIANFNEEKKKFESLDKDHIYYININNIIIEMRKNDSRTMHKLIVFDQNQ